MRIGVNALYLIPGGVGGTEIYLRNVLRELAQLDTPHEYHVFTNTETSGDICPAPLNHVPMGVRATNRPLRLIAEQTILPARARSLQIECMFNPGFTAAAFPGCPNVTVFHDLQHKRHPEYFRRFDLPAWEFFLSLAVKRSKLLIADSESTKSDLLHYYRLPEDRVRVVPLGVDEEFFRIAAQRTDIQPYLLCVSTLHPHKNIERLVRVFARFEKCRPGWKLVLVGLRGFHAEPVERLISDLHANVQITGWIPRAELYALYRNATAAVYPSTFEGFGIPVLEAMAAGVPLACSNIEPLRSLVRDAAWTFDPHDDEQMLAALESVNTDRVARGIARAREFSWRRCAQQTLAVLSEAGLRAGS